MCRKYFITAMKTYCVLYFQLLFYCSRIEAYGERWRIESMDTTVIVIGCSCATPGGDKITILCGPQFLLQLVLVCPLLGIVVQRSHVKRCQRRQHRALVIGSVSFPEAWPSNLFHVSLYSNHIVRATRQ